MAPAGAAAVGGGWVVKLNGVCTEYWAEWEDAVRLGVKEKKCRETGMGRCATDASYKLPTRCSLSKTTLSQARMAFPCANCMAGSSRWKEVMITDKDATEKSPPDHRWVCKN